MGAIGDLYNLINKYLKKIIIYLVIFLLFTFNFIALSISLQCNRTKPFMFRIASGLFAFLFGILYIGFNYLQYKIKIEKNPCVLCGDNPFTF